MTWKKISLIVLLVVVLALFTFPAALIAKINGDGYECPEYSCTCTETVEWDSYWGDYTFYSPKGPVVQIWATYERCAVGGGFEIVTESLDLTGLYPGSTDFGGHCGFAFHVSQCDSPCAVYIEETSEAEIIEVKYEYQCPCKGGDAEEVWVRDHDFQCWQVWINEQNQFEFVFVWEYENNNHVQILDQAGNVVFYIDLPKGDCHFVADLPDGIYTVQNYHEYGHILREFVISKP